MPEPDAFGVLTVEGRYDLEYSPLIASVTPSLC